MGMTGLIFEPHPPNFENQYIFMLKWFFDFSTGFRFSKISVECFVHICPWQRSRQCISYYDSHQFHFLRSWYHQNGSLHSYFLDYLRFYHQIFWRFLCIEKIHRCQWAICRKSTKLPGDYPYLIQGDFPSTLRKPLSL